MRTPAYSLRTGILAYLALLLFSAMLLINIVMVKFEERDLIQEKVEKGWLAFDTLSRMISREVVDRNRSLRDLSSNEQFNLQSDQVLRLAGLAGIMVVEKDGAAVFQRGGWGEGRKEALSLARNSLATRKPVFEFYGSTWGVIWLAHENVKLASPILIGSQVIGSMTLSTHLGPTYQTLRNSERVILLYILVNTVIFVLFGIYLLSRTIIKPIHRLLRVTEKFTGGEVLPFLEENSSNEVGQLFRSLNMMLKRLEENKKELEIHISSLEKANSEIKNAQDEIIRSEKLASVGRLATGIAHEIGNPIGIVLGYLELLKREDLNTEDKQDFLDRIETETVRINRIIRQLLDFSRTESQEKKRIGIHALIDEMLSMMKPQPMMAEIQIRPSLQARMDVVEADPNRLKQVFLNIILNAADAMGERDEESSPAVLKISTRDLDGAIELQFSDTGPGISEEEIGHIFDPFFTTKDPGKGTGLGLSVSYRIVEELGGSIRAESGPDRGTIITIRLPLSYKEKKDGHQWRSHI